MRNREKLTFWGSLLGLAAVASLTAPHTVSAAGSIKAAYVETVIPSKSYSGQVAVSYFGNTATVGPAQSGVLGLGNIVLTNSDINALSVIIGIPTLNGAACGTASFSGYQGAPMYFWVQPQSTLVIPFPTPFVVNPAGGTACIALESGGFSLDGQLLMMVTGLLN